jgi:hypothetical protein
MPATGNNVRPTTSHFAHILTNPVQHNKVSWDKKLGTRLFIYFMAVHYCSSSHCEPHSLDRRGGWPTHPTTARIWTAAEVHGETVGGAEYQPVKKLMVSCSETPPAWEWDWFHDADMVLEQGVSCTLFQCSQKRKMEWDPNWMQKGRDMKTRDSMFFRKSCRFRAKSRPLKGLPSQKMNRLGCKSRVSCSGWNEKMIQSCIFPTNQCSRLDCALNPIHLSVSKCISCTHFFIHWCNILIISYHLIVQSKWRNGSSPLLWDQISNLRRDSLLSIIHIPLLKKR